MASVSDDENINNEEPVRRTRSGRAVKTPATPRQTRKTRKKVVLVEVEVSEEEEDHPVPDEAAEVDQKFGLMTSLTSENSDSIAEMSLTEQMIEENLSNSQQCNEESSSDVLNSRSDIQNVIEDSNSVAHSEGDAFNAFATESTQDQFESTIRSGSYMVNEENNFTNSFPIEIKDKSEELQEDLEDSNEMEVDLHVEKEKSIDGNDNFNGTGTEEEKDFEMDDADEMELKLEMKDENEEIEEKGKNIEIKIKTRNMKKERFEDSDDESEELRSRIKVPKSEQEDDSEDGESVQPKEDSMDVDSAERKAAEKEVVSEDELPTVKKESNKRKIESSSEYDPGSPTSETEGSAAKRQAVEEEVIGVEQAAAEGEKPVEKDKTKEKEKEKESTKGHKLPELDKYWKAVNDDPSDFTGWTYLLQYVDQVNEIEAAREAYDAFLSHYPYCYGYWRKYADYEKRKGNKKKCEEVFERGLKAIPLSVDLWLHFLNYTKMTYAENESHIREQFERAVSACGLEFRSDRLWDTYVKWEVEGKRFQNVTSIYDRLLATPTQGYTLHFDNFQEHVANYPPNKVLSVDEFLSLRKEVRSMLKQESTEGVPPDSDIPPGEEDNTPDSVTSDEETKALKERIVSIRRKLHKVTVSAVTARWNFEEGIKRPYFHVKPLERCQLKNWKEYLDYEIEQQDRQRIIVLFERCLIACALYEEFWLRYVRFLEDLKDDSLHSKIREVYERACTVHHVGKPSLHLAWAMYEELMNNHLKASEILVNLEKSVPNLLQVAYRRINLERRREDYEKCSQLYEYYINNSKNKLISNNMAIKYARFCLKICKDSAKAIEILQAAVAKDPSNSRLYLQLIDICLQRENIDEKEVLGYIDQFLEKDGVDVEQKVLFAQRKLEFLEDFGSDIQAVRKVYDEYQKYCKLNKESAKKKDDNKSDQNTSKKSKDIQPPLPTTQSSTYGGYGGYGNSGQAASGYSQYGSGQAGGYGGQYSGQYAQGDQYQYPNWQYSQSGYGGYNQWGNYDYGYE